MAKRKYQPEKADCNENYLPIKRRNVYDDFIEKFLTNEGPHPLSWYRERYGQRATFVQNEVKPFLIDQPGYSPISNPDDRFEAISVASSNVIELKVGLGET